MVLNRDIKFRDRILFGEYNSGDYFGGIKTFTNVTYETLNELLSLNFIDPEYSQNESPTASEFMEFMKCHKGFTAHGYAVTDERNDYRITIEGIEKEGDFSKKEMIDFVNLARWADNLTVSDTLLYCWYD